ncbi:MAG TPA: prolyl oligopeptidase family serine peptidase, partial [Terriglobales bacterium]
MRILVPLLFPIFMSTLTLAHSLPTPSAITDPKQIPSKSNAQVERSLTIEKLYMTRNIGDSAWSPDGKMVAFISNISGRNNLWLVPATGGWPTQLTVSDQRQMTPAWSPDGKWIAYQSDYDGDEQWDIFFVSPKTGQVVNVTNTRQVSEETPAWSPDGRYLAYAVKPKTSSVYEVDVYDTLMRQTKHLTTDTPADKVNAYPIWSRDGKWIAYTQQQAKGTDSNIFVADVETGQSTVLTPHQGEQLYEANDFPPDGKRLLVTSNAGNGYDNVGLLDIASKKISWLTRDKWEVSAGQFAPSGKEVTWTANVDGNYGIYVHSLVSGKTTSLPVAAGVNQLAGAESAFSPDGSWLLYYHEGANAPKDLWAYSRATGKSRQLTNSLVGGVRGEDMVEPFLVHYPSRDGKWTISAFVYMPYNLPKQAISPAIVYVHGGPNSQATNSFSRFIQYAANQGYIVIAPNYRGSTGYGKEFQNANLFDMGGGDLQDVLAAAEWIKQTGYVDPKKLI